MFQNVLLFIHLKMFKTGCMLNIIYLQQTMCSTLFCVTHNNNSLGDTHVDHIL